MMIEKGSKKRRGREAKRFVGQVGARHSPAVGHAIDGLGGKDCIQTVLGGGPAMAQPPAQWQVVSDNCDFSCDRKGLAIKFLLDAVIHAAERVRSRNQGAWDLPDGAIVDSQKR